MNKDAKAMQSYLEKHDPARNQARFYNLLLLPNLFGEWTLYREWGRIGQGGKVRNGLTARIRPVPLWSRLKRPKDGGAIGCAPNSYPCFSLDECIPLRDS